MKDTGLPSPFIDIMMLSPALRTSQSSLRPGLGNLDDAAGQAEIAHQLDQAREIASCASRSSPGELDQQDRLGRADEARVGTGRKAGLAAPGRSSCDRPARRRSGSSLTICCALSIAL